MMIMRSTTLCRVLLFVSALSVLLHCIVSVWAAGNDFAQEIKDLTRTAEYSKYIKNNVPGNYEKLDKDVIGTQNLLKQALIGVNNTKTLLPKINESIRKNVNKMLDELETNINDAKNTVSDLKKTDATLLDIVYMNIEKIMTELVIKSDQLKTDIKTFGNDVGCMNNAVANEAKELQSTVNEAKKLLEDMLEKIKTQHRISFKLFLAILNADYKTRIIIDFSEYYNKNNHDEMKYKLENKVQKMLDAALTKTQKIQNAFGRAEVDTNAVIEFYKKLKNEMKELLQTHTTSTEGNNENCNINGEQLNNKNAGGPSFVSPATPLVIQRKTSVFSQLQHLTHGRTEEGTPETTGEKTRKNEDMNNQRKEVVSTQSKKQTESAYKMEDRKIETKRGVPTAKHSTVENKHNVAVTSNDLTGYNGAHVIYKAENGGGAVEKKIFYAKRQENIKEQSAEASLTSQDNFYNVQEEKEEKDANTATVLSGVSTDLTAADKTLLRGGTGASNYSDPLKTILQPKGADGAVRSCVSLLALLPSLCLWCFLTALHCCQAVAA